MNSLTDQNLRYASWDLKMNQTLRQLRRRAFRCSTAVIYSVLLLVFGAVPAANAQGKPLPASRPEAIPISEFARIVQEFSEEGGYFQADNFTSNETSYLHVVDKLKDLGVSGGAYVGVGPEQNFTYIAKIHPAIAFIVDVRREAILEHLLYKAVFHLAHDRAEFLSLLFSKPLSNDRAETKGSIEALLQYIEQAPTSEKIFSENLTTIQRTVEDDFQLPLSLSDKQSLRRTYFIFWRLNLGIAYGFGFPTLGDLIVETDLHGKKGNFLAQEQDYRFVRDLEEQNRLIPVVGNFAGPKALRAVADYLKTNGYTLSAFYTSNVEEYLYDDDLFGKFAENIAQFPVRDHSVFIRAIKGYLGPHPAWIPGNRMITLLEEIPTFLADYKAGLYPDYWSMVTTHYIAADNSSNKSRRDGTSR
jgi:hypothetical protein